MNRNGKRASALLASMALVLLGSSGAAWADPITLSAGSTTVNVGDVFAIPISIANTLGLTSFQFDVGFDPTIVQELSFADSGTDFETAATSSGGFLTGLTGFPQTDYLSGVADSMFTTGSGLTPGGSLVEITFRALASGVSPLSFSCALCGGAYLTDNGVPLFSANGDFSLQDGLITVNGASPAPVPEPMTLTLFASGLALAAGRRAVKRRRP